MDDRVRASLDGLLTTVRIKIRGRIAGIGGIDAKVRQRAYCSVNMINALFEAH
ncbi:hypothetical protein ACRS85_00815 [Pluralibacter gergoviae]|uniref:hypothetical protein n=1 Tax=Enterobacteriaceae TaxID=543 RepID=UPI002360E5E1|nr:hypothetical protein [Klebsiella variicola]